MSYDKNIREGEIIKKVANDYFGQYDNTKLIGDVDFCVSIHHQKEIFEQESLLWAEAKKGILYVVTGVLVISSATEIVNSVMGGS